MATEFPQRTEHSDAGDAGIRAISVDLVSLEKKEWSGAARAISAPSVHGQIGIWVGHTPLLAVLRHGTVTITALDGERFAFEVSKAVVSPNTDTDVVTPEEIISGDPDIDASPGFLSVDGNLVTVVADVVTPLRVE